MEVLEHLRQMAVELADLRREKLLLQNRIGQLHKALRLHAHHDRACPAVIGKCTCGLDALLTDDA